MTVFSKGDTCQTGATRKELNTDAGDTVWDCDTAQTGAISEGILPDAGDTVWDYITSLIFTIRIANYDCLIFIEENSILRRIICIIRSNLNRRQAGAKKEGIVPDACDTVWYCDVGQAGAISEGLSSNTGDTVRNRNTGQTVAKPEGILADAGDTVRNRDAGQAAAIIEGIIPDAGDTVWDRNTCQAGAFREGITTNAGDRLAFDSTWNDKFPRSRSITVSDRDRVFINTIGQVPKV